MRKILVTGSLGQLGTELVPYLRNIYGHDQVISSSRRPHDDLDWNDIKPFELVDVTDVDRLAEVVDKHRVTTIIHLAAILSATGEKFPKLLWNVNMTGLYNVLEVAREKGLTVFTPSSIAAFGPTTPKFNTPQETIQRPSTIYGVSKVAGELLCDYYHQKFGVDTRGVRYPGLISNVALPGGGTTDYAVHIFYEALKHKKFECYLKEDTLLDMMYMPDALRAIHEIMEADSNKLRYRNAYNVTAMTFDPNTLYKEIKKHIPDFEMTYVIDDIKQAIAESWPDKLDDTASREDWDWKPKFDLSRMTESMLVTLSKKLFTYNKIDF